MSPKIIDLTCICRLCLRYKQDSIDIFLHNSENEEFTLPAKIMDCISLKISSTDYGPRKICDSCLNNINQWFQFKQACKMANENLQIILKQLCDQDIFTVLKGADDKATDIIGDNSLSGISLSDFDLLPDRTMSWAANLDFSHAFQNGKDAVELIRTDNFSLSSGNLTELSNPTVSNDPKFSGILKTQNILNSNDHVENSKKFSFYQCDLCETRFSRFSDLLKHDDIEHDTIPRSHSCSVCQRLFISTYRLNIHNSIHRKKNIQCSICKKVFSSKKSLQVHSRLHTRMYECETCGFVTTSKIYLEEHVLKHQNANTIYKCKICSIQLSRKSALIRHEKIHLKHQGKLFKCPKCTVVARSYFELKNHIDSHSSEANRFFCELCNKTYSSKKTLEIHKQRHEAGKFICSICSRRVFSKYELRLHEETHTNSKPFSCFHCDKKFSFKSTFIKHIKKFYPSIRSDINVDDSL